MELLYGSTRGGETGVTASQAVLNGLVYAGELCVILCFVDSTEEGVFYA